ncbi:MAG: YkgJ family cysteine cluster protein [Pseudomonadota bacterium]|nr:YkgJ family cysteine cluster protein [Pseudomonadota bacterium]
MKPQLIPAADVDRLDTWQKYRKGLCDSCRATCCTLPVEVRLEDLIRLGLVDEFERGEPLKQIAKRLQREGVVERFHQKSGVFTLSRMSNDDCLFLDARSRRCTVYDRRPATCRNHPQVGPRPGFCAYRPKP